MANAQRIEKWIEGYRRAWESNEPADIGALFTEDAEYYTAPFRPAWRGRDEIVAGWLEAKDEPGETSFDWKPVVVTDELAVVEGVTTYPDEVYSNLWLIVLDPDGRCRRFTEWFMRHPIG
ncbi:MAG TPA: nuclear transport factor 2 family protein [Candidatus Limnocylindrales bacterium]